MCWRLDNFIGNRLTEMGFWDYEDTAKSDAKEKKWKKNNVAQVHDIFRKYMGAVNQSDVKAYVMEISHEYTPHWYEKQLAFLVETKLRFAMLLRTLIWTVVLRRGNHLHNSMIYLLKTCLMNPPIIALTTPQKRENWRSVRKLSFQEAISNGWNDHIKRRALLHSTEHQFPVLQQKKDFRILLAKIY